MRILEIPSVILGDGQLRDLLEMAVTLHRHTENPDLVPVIGALRAEITSRKHSANRYGPDVVKILRGRPALRVVEGEGKRP